MGRLLKRIFEKNIKSGAMESNKELFESLFEKVTEYGKTNFELLKLRVLDKASDVVSSLIPHTVVFVLIFSCLFFISLGLAFWLGEILGNVYFGFFVVAAFYGIIGLFMRLFFYKLIKRAVCDYIIKQVLK